MKSKTYKKTHLSHFLLLGLLMSIVIYLQSYAFAILPKPFCLVDVSTVLIIYLFFENELLTSFFLAILSGSLLDSLSVIKPGFFMVYLLISLLILQILSRLLSFDNLSNKFIVFIGLFALKFLFLYLLMDDSVVSVFAFSMKHYGQFLSSSIFFLLLAKILDVFRGYSQKRQYSYNVHFKNWR